VFGCGGNRDATKRPLMGAIAARLADRVVVTSDNPRAEDARSIVQQVLAGTEGAALVEAIVDRRAAIAHALAAADAADVVLLAGKGHERYQEIAGVRHPFADAEVAAEALARRPGAAR
jgi:UDP-N-acetylmuramoyl-L-alanyl-D-glutamate--2,6-diaminopimelate ligase